MNQPQTQIVIVKEQGNALGLAGLIFSILGWLTCGILCPLGALLSFFGLFSRGPKSTAIAGLVVGFPGVIFLGVFGLGFILTFLGIGGAAIRQAGEAATKARQQAEMAATNPSPTESPTEGEVATNEAAPEVVPVDPAVLAEQARIAEQKELEDRKRREMEAAQKAQLEKDQAEQAIVKAREDRIKQELAEEHRKAIAAVEYRGWSSKDGKFNVTADLVKINELTVTLKRQDNGKEIEVPLEKLSKGDNDYVNNLK